MIIFYFFLIAGFGFIGFYMLEFMFGLQLTNRQRQKDLSSLKSILDDFEIDLIPFSGNDIEILSMNIITQRIRKFFQNIYKGSLSTIYHEAIIKFATKTYSGGRQLLIARTSDAEYVYIDNGKTVEFFMDDKKIGIISEEGQLLTQNGSELASIDMLSDPEHHHVYIEGRDVASLINPTMVHTENQRAFPIIKELELSDYQAVTALVLYDLLIQNFNV